MDKAYITNPEELKEYIELSEGEKAFFDGRDVNSLPLRVSRHWMELMGTDPGDPLRRQSIPRKEEFNLGAEESDDPIGDRTHSPVRGLIHHYLDRALILITDKCAMYCRHCFRRHHTGKSSSLSLSEMDDIMAYLSVHDDIHEVIISGGDSMMAPFETLRYLFEGLNRIGRPLVKRVGTRFPVVDPCGMDLKKVDLLSEQNSLWLVLQVNHTKEMSPEFDSLISLLRGRGIPLLNQAVLLRGVNDSAEAQRNLSYALIERGIKPYYLFQGDLAEGTGHLRVSLDRALAIYGELSRTISHLALPRFALDLPGGGGKVNLDESSFVKRDGEYYYFKNGNGETGRYPRECE
jgi:lysine 2,3-aminomutase